MIGASLLMWVLGRDGDIGRGDGVLLVALLICYVAGSVYQTGRLTGAI